MPHLTPAQQPLTLLSWSAHSEPLEEELKPSTGNTGKSQQLQILSHTDS